ncbi:hypothetical protein B0H19DRAFT_1066710 [Mycena capillaripes]|nr:hypothetical protein B0H19DRAFT_1066710 [Mycena capillaripes]
MTTGPVKLDWNPKVCRTHPLLRHPDPIEIDCLFEPRAVKLASDFFGGTEANRNRYLWSSFPGRYSPHDTSEKTQDLLLLNIAHLSLAIEATGPPPSSAHPTRKSKISSLTSKTGPAYEGERHLRHRYQRDPRLRLRQNYRRDESTNDKGRLLKEAHNHIIESHVYNLRNSLNDEKLADKIAAAGELKLYGTVNDTIKWLNVSQQGLKEDQADACVD